MGFGKFLKKAVKLGSKIAKPLLATTPIGAVALRAQQTLKSLGGNLKAARLGKVQPLSVRSSVEKIAAAAPAKRITLRPARMTSRGTAYQTMQDMRAAGGLTRAQSTGITGFNGTSRKRKRARMPQKRKTTNGMSKRVPPKGGLDLAAMAAQWRAAGKPGTWQGWIKSNPMKKA
jgi:hypothetical protein